MNKPSAVQTFVLIAIVVGGVVSYFPPEQNAVQIWSLVSGFLGYAIRDLFGNQSTPPKD